ncbi:MAG: glycosyltransferase family 2 protein [Candidatus Omnitrophota bacterium]
MTDLSISIVNYNSREDLIGCLESIKDQGQSPAGTVPTWVIDNASTESIRDLEEKYKWVDFIYNKINIGFGAANNIAISRSDSKYHLVLNPDIRIKKQAIDELASFMEKNPDVGVAGPRLVYGDGKLQYSCRRFPTFTTFVSRGLFPEKKTKAMADYLMLDKDHNSGFDCDWVLGSCLMAKKCVLDGLKGFDESYFMYYEDIDLCYRAKKAGFRVAYDPSAEATHTYKRESAGGLFNKLKYHHAASAMRFFAKYLGERKWGTFI